MQNRILETLGKPYILKLIDALFDEPTLLMLLNRSFLYVKNIEDLKECITYSPSKKNALEFLETLETKELVDIISNNEFVSKRKIDAFITGSKLEYPSNTCPCAYCGHNLMENFEDLGIDYVWKYSINYFEHSNTSTILCKKCNKENRLRVISEEI